MNIIRSSLSRFSGVINSNRSHLVPEPQTFCRRCGPLSSLAEGSEVFQQFSWHYQQVRTKKRGTEYQPNNLKRKRTHGWIKRLSSQGGVEVLLRRMLKGRKSLSH